jgi:hypothetical protein
MRNSSGLKLFKKHLIFEAENGITLCKNCHLKLHGLVKMGG